MDQRSVSRRHKSTTQAFGSLPYPDAVLLDVDGTLVDSNYLNVFAWLRTFEELNIVVPAWRIHRAIGMDSGLLLSDLLGEGAERMADQIKETHGRYYAKVAGPLHPLPGARELLSALSRRKITVVLASSAPPDELDRIRDVLDVEEHPSAIANASDVETAKPAPDIVAVALKKAGVPPERALFVGDAVWGLVKLMASSLKCRGSRQIAAGSLARSGWALRSTPQRTGD